MFSALQSSSQLSAGFGAEQEHVWGWLGLCYILGLFPHEHCVAALPSTRWWQLCPHAPSASSVNRRLKGSGLPRGKGTEHRDKLIRLHLRPSALLPAIAQREAEALQWPPASPALLQH